MSRCLSGKMICWRCDPWDRGSMDAPACRCLVLIGFTSFAWLRFTLSMRGCVPAAFRRRRGRVNVVALRRWWAAMRLGILGSLLVADDHGNQITVAAARQRTLLAALLVRANRTVPVEELAELVWDTAPP